MKSLIQTPTNSLPQSLEFYQKLGFETLSEENKTLVSDGKTLIEINPDRFARAGVKLYADSWQNELEKLRSLVNIIEIENGFLFASPTGTWVYLMEQELAHSAITNLPSSVLGNFAGLSLETADMAKSLQIWETLGFKQSAGDLAQGWLSLANAEGFGISLMKPLMCPHLFFNPSLTYFNGKDNLSIIQKIRELQIPITEEITHFNKEGIVDNIIIRDPGGLGFFLFSD